MKSNRTIHRLLSLALSLSILMGVMSTSAIKANALTYTIGGAEYTVGPRPDPQTVSFDDVPEDAWYHDAVYAVAELGIMNGYGNGKFGPDDTLSLYQLGLIIWRLAGFKYIKPDLTQGVISQIVCDTCGIKATQTTSGTIRGEIPYPIDPELKQLYLSITVPADCAPFEMLIRSTYITGTGLNLKNVPSTYYGHDHETGKTTGPWNLAANRLSVIYAITTVLERSELTDDRETMLANAAANGRKVWTEDDIPDWDKIAAILLADHSDSAKIILDAYNLGIVNGVDTKGTCAPNANVTRAQVCQLLYNAGIVDLLNAHPETGDLYLSCDITLGGGNGIIKFSYDPKYLG